MNLTKLSFKLLFIMIIVALLSGCWNYREVDKLGIVAGVAVDKDNDYNYMLTIELVIASGGKETNQTSKIITTKGDTIFEAARNAILVLGKRLYWSHAKVLIISEEIARDGLVKVIDWYSRDSETRADVSMIISHETSAGQLLESDELSENIKSFELDQMLKNQVSINKAPLTDVLKFQNYILGKYSSAIIPVAHIASTNGKKTAQISGTAFFKGDKLAGFLDSDETRELLFIKDEIKRGVLSEGKNSDIINTPLSIEIFESKTKIIPCLRDGNIEMDIRINTITAIDEVNGSENYFTPEGINKVQKALENTLKTRLEKLISKLQSQYQADIFEFSTKLRSNKNKVWKKVSENWDEVFKDINVNLQVKFIIRNTGTLAKTIGDAE